MKPNRTIEKSATANCRNVTLLLMSRHRLAGIGLLPMRGAQARRRDELVPVTVETGFVPGAVSAGVPTRAHVRPRASRPGGVDTGGQIYRRHCGCVECR